MFTAKMWWAKTWVRKFFHPKGVNLVPENDGNVKIEGSAGGPGCGVFSCDSRFHMLAIRMQYFLTTDRMPKDDEAYRTVWDSNPNLTFHYGHRVIGAWTLSGTMPIDVFDSSSAKCWIETRQSAHQGGKQIGISEMLKRTLIEIRNDNWVLREELLPHNLWVGKLVFVLDRTKDLEIDIDIFIITELEGEGSIFYHAIFDNKGYIKLQIRPWDISTSEPVP